ncbi:mitochondrial grpe [Auriculariales sp. MPI-PUGE-AT-0066]|nr:mitochondrial grpe [Auriculariales sp. MPI-PUGE-AT-0066]
MSASLRVLRQCSRVALRAPTQYVYQLHAVPARPLVASLQMRRAMSTTASEEPAPDASAYSAEPASDSAETKLKAKDEEIADLTSRLRYAQADLVNQQRIATREKEQQRDFAISRFAADLLETADVLAIALRSLDSKPSDSAPDPATAVSSLETLRSGVDITQKQLLSTFAKYGVVSFDPTGRKFDPNQHEALYEAPAPNGEEAGTVISCQKVGYTLKDRILRAAQVGVARS